ncbi:hypothetical protein D3C78_1545840 [compost metagenome]
MLLEICGNQVRHIHQYFANDRLALVHVIIAAACRPIVVHDHLKLFLCPQRLAASRQLHDTLTYRPCRINRILYAFPHIVIIMLCLRLQISGVYAQTAILLHLKICRRLLQRIPDILPGQPKNSQRIRVHEVDQHVPQRNRLPKAL